MEIKQTKNYGLLVGVLSEKDLKIEDGKFNDKSGKEKPCKIVKGSLTIETDNGLFPLRVYSRDKKTDNTENSFYKGLETIATTYVSKLDATKEGKEPDVVSCNIKLNCNDYVGLDGNIRSVAQINMSKANRIQGEYQSTTDLNLEGVIRSIKPEIIKEEETGRLVVEFVTIGYGGVAEPFNLVVPEDLADDFTSMFEVGQTCMLYVSLVMKHVGGSNKKQAGFGRKGNVNSGFDVLEIQVIGGEVPYEDETDDEGNSKAIDLKTMKQLMNEREMVLEQKVKEAKDNPKGKKEDKQRGLGKKSNLPQPSVEDSESLCPF